MSSAHRVLASPELLCLIFLEADQQTLLTSAQRVCRAWYQEIRTAPLLRRHLFFTVPPMDGVTDSQVTKRVRNPLLRQAFPAWFDYDVYFRTIKNTRYHNNNLQYAIVSSGYSESFMARLSEAWVKDNSEGGESPALDLDKVLDGTGIVKEQGANNPFLRTDASWLQMHISDPPVTRVGLLQGNSGSDGEDTIEEVPYPDGLRMGQYYVLVMACSRLLNCGYRIQIQWPPEPLGRTIHRYAEKLDMCPSARVNQGLMRADVLVLVGRGFPVEMAEPTDQHERILIAGGFVFFMEHYGEEFERIESLLTKPRMEQYLGYYLK